MKNHSRQDALLPFPLELYQPNPTHPNCYVDAVNLGLHDGESKANTYILVDKAVNQGKPDVGLHENL